MREIEVSFCLRSLETEHQGGPKRSLLRGETYRSISSENTRTFVYDLSNQLIQVWDGSTQTASHTYNGAGQRIKKATQTETRIFHYDLRGHLIAETNQTGQMLGEYIYLGDQLLSMIKPGEAVYYYHNDHLGTPQVLTDDAQTIAWKAAYTPFGDAVASIQTVDNPFRFPGQYYDQETGLHYNYFRYYNPQTGRYITPDPIGLEGGINLFAYVNNPVNRIDPFGLAENILNWPAIFWGAEKAAGTAVTAAGTAAAGIATGVVAGIVIVFWPSEIAEEPTESNLMFSKQLSKDRNWATEKAKEIAQATGKTPCDALDKMLEEAKCSGDSKKVKDIESAQKWLGCRNIQKRRSK